MLEFERTAALEAARQNDDPTCIVEPQALAQYINTLHEHFHAIAQTFGVTIVETREHHNKSRS